MSQPRLKNVLTQYGYPVENLETPNDSQRLPGQAESPTKQTSSDDSPLSLTRPVATAIAAARLEEVTLSGTGLALVHTGTININIMARTLLRPKAPNGSVIIQFRPDLSVLVTQVIDRLDAYVETLTSQTYKTIATNLKHDLDRATTIADSEDSAKEAEQRLQETARVARLQSAYYVYVETLNLLAANEPICPAAIVEIYEGRRKPGENYRSPVGFGRTATTLESPLRRAVSAAAHGAGSPAHFVTSPPNSSVTAALRLENPFELSQAAHLCLEGNLGANGSPCPQPELYLALRASCELVSPPVNIFTHTDDFKTNFDTLSHVFGAAEYTEGVTPASSSSAASRSFMQASSSVEPYARLRYSDLAPSNGLPATDLTAPVNNYHSAAPAALDTTAGDLSPRSGNSTPEADMPAVVAVGQLPRVESCSAGLTNPATLTLSSITAANTLGSPRVNPHQADGPEKSIPAAGEDMLPENMMALQVQPGAGLAHQSAESVAAPAVTAANCCCVLWPWGRAQAYESYDTVHGR